MQGNKAWKRRGALLKVSVLLFVLLIGVSFSSINVEQLAQKAKSGDVNAIYQLGYCYENGIGVTVDNKKAFDLYNKAAHLGSEDAKLSLELMNLHNTSKVRSKENQIRIASIKDEFSATLLASDLKEIVTKARSGDKEALYTLGVMYENGIKPIKQDREKALLFYKKAAKAGSIKAKQVIELTNSPSMPK